MANRLPTEGPLAEQQPGSDGNYPVTRRSLVPKDEMFLLNLWMAKPIQASWTHRRIQSRYNERALAITSMVSVSRSLCLYFVAHGRYP